MLTEIIYDPILTPATRVELFLKALEQAKAQLTGTMSEDFIKGIEHANKHAEIWFADELEAIKLRKN